jgi:hypothetical protein
VKRRGKRKKRSRRRHRGAAARRAQSAPVLGDLPLGVLTREGLLHACNGTAPTRRVRASRVERAHVERLRADPELWGPLGR